MVEEDRAALDSLWDACNELNDASHPAWAALTHIKDRLAALAAARPAILAELESALCAPDWPASLCHVHEAIRKLGDDNGR